jgi:hypothetical protein
MVIVTQSVFSQATLTREAAFKQVIEIFNKASKFDESLTDIKVTSSDFKKLTMTVQGYSKVTMFSPPSNDYTELIFKDLIKVEKTYKGVELFFKKKMKTKREFLAKNTFKVSKSYKKDSYIIRPKNGDDKEKLINALNTLMK